jgi:2-phosphosulfolactate phosphatase
VHVDVFPAPDGFQPGADTTAVVVDVFRATTTITTALASGCRFILPAADVEQAVRLIEPFRNGEGLLGGERDCVKIDGFHLGNSPAEYAPEVVGNRVVVFTSTNGTRALLAAAGAGPVLLGCFLNVGAVARRLAGAGSVAVVCAGNEGRFALEDFVCAGALVARLGRGVEAGDAAVAARATFRALTPNLARALTATSHARRLAALGFKSDLALALRLDALSEVPVYQDGRITLA